MYYSRKNFNALGAWMKLATSYSRMTMSAAEVIMRRSMRMASGAMTPPEAIGMVMEKATVAAARGGDAARIASAALRPYGSKTRSNVRKLRR